MTRAEFADFYAATYHRVAAQLYAYLGDHAEAQDLAQEAFTRAFDRWGRVGVYENPDAWVRRVAWNLATSRLRHLHVLKRFVAGHREEPVTPPGPERVDLGRALAALPANHRLAVVLHHVGQLSTLEIAQQCGVAEGTVRSWLSRGRSRLAEQLVDWEPVAVAAPEGGAEAVVAKVKRRRAARRTIAAAALAVLVAVPLALALLGRGGQPPVIEPTPPPSSSPSPATGFETRRVTLPGLSLTDVSGVEFVDRDHGWLWADRVAATTADGGRTWRRVTSPPITPGHFSRLMVYDGDTATIQVTDMGVGRPSNYWHTTDGGATWTSHPAEKPPAETVISQVGRYRMLCPGATGLNDGAVVVRCDRYQLVMIGSGPTPRQPPLGTRETRVFEGPDGRLWLLAPSRQPRLFLSEDSAHSWRELTAPPMLADGTLFFSPDGRQVVANVYGSDKYWELAGSQWVERDLGLDPGSSPLLLEDGVWLVRRRGSYGYLKDGVFTAIPGTPPADGFVQRLSDGTVLIDSGSAIVVGVGAGMRREWVRITA